MQADVHALFIHGVGAAHAGYSAFAQRKLAASLGLRGITLHAQEVTWAPVLDVLEQKMLADVGKLGSANNIVQRLSIGTAADATSYHNCQATILRVVDEAFARLRSPEVHVFGHSLGVMVALDWLRSRPYVRGTLTSFGANVQMFELGATFDCPQQLRAEKRWRNAFYREDGLGFPLAKFQPQVEDLEVSKPFWRLSTLVPALSHVDYWGDAQLWSSTIPGGF